MAAQIISETPISMYQLKEELARIKKRDKELNLRATKAEEHIEHLPNYANTQELFEKITKLNVSRLKDQHVYKIIDTMPTTIKDLKVVLQGYTISVNNDNMKKIVDTITAFIAKK
jgi:DNA-directed RNA polymerase subunit F